VESLADLIAFNDANPALEEPAGFGDNSILIASQATTGRNATFFAALEADMGLGGSRGIDAALANNNLDALILPAPGSTTQPPAVVGYPIVTVPLGFFADNTTIRSGGPGTVFPAPGMPFGLCFLASKFSEFELIGFAYAYEQATMTRLARKAFPAAIPVTQLVDVMSHK
jgi:amidase